MKKQFLTISLLCGCVCSNSQKITGQSETGIKLNPAYSKAAKIDSIIKSYAPSILPGVSIAVYTEAEGWWANTAGYADVKQKIPMQNDHLQYLQSVAKMYMAVAILKLKEEGKIDLDAPMTKYLPAKYARHIKDGEKVTVRMLLNHTSGIREYNEDPEFVSKVVMNPRKNFTALECLQYIGGKDPEAPAGSRYRYVNTNYMLLALIGDALTGNHADYIRKHIFQPLQLKNTYYGNGFTYLDGLHLPESYWDVFNVGIPINVTPFQKMTVVCSKGDDGIVATTTDVILFFKGLVEGKLLNPASMEEMMNFVKDEKGNKRYGMGMIYFDFGGIIAYGHGGGGVGAGCGLLYFPEQKIYTFFSTNLGVFPEGKLPDKAGAMRDEILKALVE
jgi:D-alanyl-D-alanine carboxypeptidase